MSLLLVSEMAKKYLDSWKEREKNVIDNLNQLGQIGTEYIDLWTSATNNDLNCFSYEKRIIKHLEAIDEDYLNMQKCIVNVFRSVSYPRKQLQERIEYRRIHLECQNEILELQKQLADEGEKCRALLKENEIFLRRKEKNGRSRRNFENYYAMIKVQKKLDEVNHENSELKLCLINKENEGMDYQKNIRVLEENVCYFVKQYEKILIENQELHTKLNKTHSESIAECQRTLSWECKNNYTGDEEQSDNRNSCTISSGENPPFISTAKNECLNLSSTSFIAISLNNDDSI